jgi:hypothetical protein
MKNFLLTALTFSLLSWLNPAPALDTPDVFAFDSHDANKKKKKGGEEDEEDFAFRRQLS